MSDPESQRRPLKKMFDAVPRRYDLINRLFTLRLDERWRRRAARACLADGPRRVVDLACGTGDLALRIARMAEPVTEVIGADFSEPMLEVARAKAQARGLAERAAFIWADAAGLPFEDESVDAIGITFGFRNLTWKNPHAQRHLAELLRVLSPGGRLVVVESSQPRSAALRSVVHWYQRAVVARLGGALSGQKNAYRYLAESAKRFYDADQVDGLLAGAGFESIEHKLLLRGVAALHVAIKARAPA